MRKVTVLTEQQRNVMDHAIDRLERMWITARYTQVWWDFMDDEEKQLHLSRLTEDLGNASQVAGYWRDFARQNGIKLPDEG